MYSLESVCVKKALKEATAVLVKLAFIKDYYNLTVNYPTTSILSGQLNCMAGGSRSHVDIECESISSTSTFLCSFDGGPSHHCKHISNARPCMHIQVTLFTLSRYPSSDHHF